MRDQESVDALIRLGCWVWCQPQCLVGWVMHWFYPRGVPDGWTTTVHWRNRAGLSLGPWIFIHRGASIKGLQHEYGHSIQSWILGPLYLLIVGLPSLLWALNGRRGRIANLRSYFEFWTERWADKLAKVER